MEYKVIKEYYGIEVGTIRKSNDQAFIDKMINEGYWEEIKLKPIQQNEVYKRKDMPKPEIKKAKRGRPKNSN